MSRGESPITIQLGDLIHNARTLDRELRTATEPSGSEYVITAYMGSGKTNGYLWLLTAEGKGQDKLRTELQLASVALQEAVTPAQRREAVRRFLAALAELISRLLGFLVAVLLLLLSRSARRPPTEDHAEWQPDPVDASPSIVPRGPNHVFPVFINRGGHSRSTLGSVALTA